MSQNGWAGGLKCAECKYDCAVSRGGKSWCINCMAAEIDELRKDKERLDRLSELVGPEFYATMRWMNPMDAGLTLRECIDETL